MYRGIPASPGVVIAKAFLLDRESIQVTKEKIEENEVTKEILKFKKALSDTKEEVLKIKEKVAKRIDPDHAKIFEAQVMILEDGLINDAVIEKIKQEKSNAEFVYRKVIEQTITTLSASKDEYLRERIMDINAVANRLIYNLLGIKHLTLESINSPVILVAKSLSPGDVVHMKKESILGFATDMGGGTSHVALLAKSMGIPAVVGLKNFFDHIQDKQNIILDGTKGEVVICPDEQTLKEYEKRKKYILQKTVELSELKSLPAETSDGRRIELSANIELPLDVDSAIEYGAEGVGLFRTEYLYIARADFPTEEEQYKAYSEVAQKVYPESVILRTFDLGGDKFDRHTGDLYETNPFLGWRAIRACLDLPEMFKIQLRAMLKASAKKNVKIMFPMISEVGELKRAKAILNEAKEELRRKKIPFDEDIPVGIMVEIPSAALAGDALAKECDFFSIGTNDLIQYTLAVDRGNEKIAYLFQGFHPAVLKLIKQTIDAAHNNGIWAGLCGEMAADPLATPMLVGMGVDELSTSAMAIPEIKKIIRSIEFEDAKKHAQEVLKLSTIEDVKKFLTEDYAKRFGKENKNKLT
ncbi:MAG: phosphoenolpyruvate-protein phosphotransferase [candidate division Zixibacteria bacterium SM23_73_3]|nr:MAG: phosphoenolpyruvate-protein phosphotransferase [candidate division Zixibacteria bacterium SM23_73_3]